LNANSLTFLERGISCSFGIETVLWPSTMEYNAMSKRLFLTVVKGFLAFNRTPWAS